MPETIGDRLVRGDKGRPLDGLAAPWGAVVGGFYRLPGTRPIKDLLHGTWVLRHPLHPAVTDVVVGGFTAAAALDVAYLVGREQALARPTDIVLVLSLAFALVSIATGATDWNETYGNERRLGVLHGTLMLVITLGYAVSLWMRLAGGARDGAIWLALVLWVLLAVTSHLGGEMAFGFGTGVDRQAWIHPPDDWTALGVRADALSERHPVRAMAGDVPVVLVRLEGRIRAIGATCTHAGGPLDEGDLVGRDGIRCPWHHSVFSLRTGAAIHGPATMDEPALETRVGADGRVEVRGRSA